MQKYRKRLKKQKGLNPEMRFSIDKVHATEKSRDLKGMYTQEITQELKRVMMIKWYNLQPLYPDREEVKEWMNKATLELERLDTRNEQLEKILQHILPEMSGEVFITGRSDDRDEQGFPDRLIVCNQYGSNSIRIYKRKDKDDVQNES